MGSSLLMSTWTWRQMLGFSRFSNDIILPCHSFVDGLNNENSATVRPVHDLVWSDSHLLVFAHSPKPLLLLSTYLQTIWDSIVTVCLRPTSINDSSVFNQTFDAWIVDDSLDGRPAGRLD
mmetsp:Transcript_8030/g.19930  ORF Transcript_8030/g.19930 Transcript_8030/m.19930 type:complete len:120 (-) Transcript_8030:56-415(-)